MVFVLTNGLLGFVLLVPGVIYPIILMIYFKGKFGELDGLWFLVGAFIIYESMFFLIGLFENTPYRFMCSSIFGSALLWLLVKITIHKKINWSSFPFAIFSGAISWMFMSDGSVSPLLFKGQLLGIFVGFSIWWLLNSLNYSIFFQDTTE